MVPFYLFLSKIENEEKEFDNGTNRKQWWSECWHTRYAGCRTEPELIASIREKYYDEALPPWLPIIKPLNEASKASTPASNVVDDTIAEGIVREANANLIPLDTRVDTRHGDGGGGHDDDAHDSIHAVPVNDTIKKDTTLEDESVDIKPKTKVTPEQLHPSVIQN